MCEMNKASNRSSDESNHGLNMSKIKFENANCTFNWKIYPKVTLTVGIGRGREYQILVIC